VASADRAVARLGWTPERTLADMVADAWAFSGGTVSGGSGSGDAGRDQAATGR
jgi:UDP-glucose 4-epimerase